MLRVLHLTDPHLFADTGGRLRGIVTHTSLSSVLAHYRDSAWAADIAVCTGDLIQDSSQVAYTHFRSLLGELGLPVYCVPGNHDVRPLMLAAMQEAPFHYCASVEQAGWLIIGIDTCIDDQAGGFLADEELARLDQAIADSDAAHVMVCLHHPPVDVGSSWLDSVGLDNGNEVLDRFTTSGKVRLAIFGHVHQAYDANHRGISIVGTPSTCRQFAQGSDNFAVDDNPPAYRRIELHDDGGHASELIWVADA